MRDGVSRNAKRQSKQSISELEQETHKAPISSELDFSPAALECNQDEHTASCSIICDTFCRNGRLNASCIHRIELSSDSIPKLLFNPVKSLGQQLEQDLQSHTPLPFIPKIFLQPKKFHIRIVDTKTCIRSDGLKPVATVLSTADTLVNLLACNIQKNLYCHEKLLFKGQSAHIKDSVGNTLLHGLNALKTDKLFRVNSITQSRLHDPFPNILHIDSKPHDGLRPLRYAMNHSSLLSIDSVSQTPLRVFVMNRLKLDHPELVDSLLSQINESKNEPNTRYTIQSKESNSSPVTVDDSVKSRLLCDRHSSQDTDILNMASQSKNCTILQHTTDALEFNMPTPTSNQESLSQCLTITSSIEPTHLIPNASIQKKTPSKPSNSLKSILKQRPVASKPSADACQQLIQHPKHDIYPISSTSIANRHSSVLSAVPSVGGYAAAFRKNPTIHFDFNVYRHFQTYKDPVVKRDKKPTLRNLKKVNTLDTQVPDNETAVDKPKPVVLKRQSQTSLATDTHLRRSTQFELTPNDFNSCRVEDSNETQVTQGSVKFPFKPKLITETHNMPQKPLVAETRRSRRSEPQCFTMASANKVSTCEITNLPRGLNRPVYSNLQPAGLSQHTQGSVNTFRRFYKPAADYKQDSRLRTSEQTDGMYHLINDEWDIYPRIQPACNRATHRIQSQHMSYPSQQYQHTWMNEYDPQPPSQEYYFY
ncbi:hypothetical protein O5D80_007256 [Batrachochytrium dendrobatidis]|nr:hypothetical protein O5D80_007256 [Batrachochytrium dendrobatidis]